MASIVLRDIRKSYGTTPVLRGVSLKIEAGEFVSLLGPSGCGKSTLLRIVAGLEGLDEGSLEIRDRDVRALPPAARNLAMVFQSYALYPHLSVRENMMVPLKMRDLNGFERLPLFGALSPGRRDKLAAMRAKVDAAADTLRLGALMDRKPGQLSGGQRQRVALGRAMVRDPVAFLMDEPLSNLDAALRVHMRTEIAQLHRTLKTTFIYVTHDQVEAMTMSDRIAVMLDGEIVQVGTPAAIYEDPRDVRVAEFIGSPKINLLDAIANEAGQPVVAGVAVPRAFEATPGAKLRLGIRPEHLVLAAPDASALNGTLEHLENLGAEVLLHIALAGQVTPEGQGQRIIARCEPPQARGLVLGAQLGLTFHADDVKIFGGDGKRIAARPLSVHAPRGEAHAPRGEAHAPRGEAHAPRETSGVRVHG